MGVTYDFAVETRGLTRLHGRKRTLDGLDIALPRGGIHAVIGANSAGKSTLFRLPLGFHKLDAGDCFVLGRRSESLTPTDRGRIGFVNDEHTLPPSPGLRWLLWMTCGLFVLALLWAVLGKVDVVAVAAGETVPGGNVKFVHRSAATDPMNDRRKRRQLHQ